MKNILLLLLCFVSTQFIHANNFNTYKTHIATDKLIVLFNDGVSAEEKAAIIRASGAVTGFTHLPWPALTICNTENMDGAKNYFTALPQVKFVSFFIADDNGHEAGVLNTFFVKLKDKNFEPMLREKLKQLNLGAPVADKYIPNLYKATNLKTTTQNTVDLCGDLVNQGWCEYAVPNYLLNPIVCADPLFVRQWHIKNTGSGVQGSGTVGADMDVDSAWTLTTGDPTIKVGLIDSGVDTLHADLRDNLLPGHDALGDSTDGYPTPVYPNDGHGTCCAGIIAAVKDNGIGVAGVAPSCKVIPVRAFYYIQLSTNGEPLPYSSAEAFADGIGWAWSVAGADILSSSWALPNELIGILPGGPQPVEDAIRNAYANARGGKGLAMFHSSGNGGTTNGPLWPGSMTETISVNASNMCDMPVAPGDCSGATWSGDYGPGLDFAAPGVRVPTTDMIGTNGFSNNEYDLTFGGTSASCPNAAAVGALVLSLRPELRAEDVRNIIAKGCDKVGCTYDVNDANGTWCPRMGFGRVNAYKALQQSFIYSGINNTNGDVALGIFPNPTNGALNINLTGISTAIARIYNFTGAELLQMELKEGLNEVDAGALPAGIYLVRTDTGSRTVTNKVTIIR
ncbi:MAG TPA: S8/S53 family peptidase [Chitinophagales bacterium]|nr:S8/S53 family peptidase [Chitinophagales bacterium]